MTLDELDAHERLALGALLRMVITSDRRFTPQEQAAVETCGDRHGSREILWGAMSEAALQSMGGDQTRDAAARVTRPDVRLLIVSIMDAVAVADGVHPNEHHILTKIRELWADTAGPYR
jgi:hypothetical protein